MNRLAAACWLGLGLGLALCLGACNDKQAATTPAPHPLTAEAIGHFCGMNVLEHPGPKGQAIVASLIEPIWFSSARDAIAFTMLPDEPKDVQAVYVSDMAKAASFDKPGRDNWVDARKAVFVIGSHRKGGMGAEEAVPFSDRAAAERFASDNGGRLVTLAEIPRDYVLGSDDHADTAAPGGAPDGNIEDSKVQHDGG